jgi:hypothetical protein
MTRQAARGRAVALMRTVLAALVGGLALMLVLSLIHI